MDLGEHVAHVAREETEHRGEHVALSLGANVPRRERDLERDDEEEDRDRRVADEDHPRRDGRASVHEDGLDQEDPADRQQGECGDDTVVDDSRTPLRRTRAGVHKTKETSGKTRVARERQQVRDDAAMDRQHAKGIEFLACVAVSNEEDEPGEQRPPRPNRAGTVTDDADDGRDGRSDGRKDEDQCRGGVVDRKCNSEDRDDRDDEAPTNDGLFRGEFRGGWHRCNGSVEFDRVITHHRT